MGEIKTEKIVDKKTSSKNATNKTLTVYSDSDDEEELKPTGTKRSSAKKPVKKIKDDSDLELSDIEVENANVHVL